MFRFKKWVAPLALSLIISGCSLGGSPEEKMYEHMEKSVTLEEVFQQQQEPLVKLEEQEQKLYEQIKGLSMTEFSQIQKLSDQAIEIVEQRKEHLLKEKESIEASKEEFAKVQPFIEKIEDDVVKGKANELYNVMEQRYVAYQTLFDQYEKALTLDKELYEMFKQEDLTLEATQQHVEKINENYKSVIEANENFNKQTEQYNLLKQEFYKSTDLNIVFDEN
ncbi:YkyA family protein [Bacillus solimangrovi]|uniref:Cell-wall binding lipoprotein n=1 Tax=Bacillus solimangrovi TaxID=1305675 RepID=A0A1E5LFZ7_9BACI|nr:YkyA family protein [Bacillus solimangrovi]OEH92994.1 hypothetical protein BFG57_14115 [Bacillus solimangrovi]